MRRNNTASDLAGFGYPFYVDYAKPIEKLILEGGYAKIDEIFSLELEAFKEYGGKKRTEAEGFLKHFGSCVFPDYKEFLKNLNESNLRPADIRELLCFGSSYRYIQRQFDVVAMGSINNSGYHLHAPELSSSNMLIERTLDIFMFKDEEYGFCCSENILPLKGQNRFLVLSKN